MAHDVGKDVLSYCGKCKLKLSHLIVAMDEKRILKAQCNTCKDIHAFKDPATAKRKAKTTTRRKSAAVPIEEIWQQAMDVATKDAVNYALKQKFEIGDVLAHKTFGSGIVNSIIDQNKIEVIFQTEMKTLVHNIGN